MLYCLCTAQVESFKGQTTYIDFLMCATEEEDEQQDEENREDEDPA